MSTQIKNITWTEMNNEQKQELITELKTNGITTKLVNAGLLSMDMFLTVAQYSDDQRQNAISKVIGLIEYNLK